LSKNLYFYFSRIILQELIITSLFITKAILHPFSLPSMYGAQGILKHHFQSIKYGTPNTRFYISTKRVTCQKNHKHEPNKNATKFLLKKKRKKLLFPQNLTHASYSFLSRFHQNSFITENVERSGIWGNKFNAIIYKYFSCLLTECLTCLVWYCSTLKVP